MRKRIGNKGNSKKGENQMTTDEFLDMKDKIYVFLYNFYCGFKRIAFNIIIFTIYAVGLFLDFDADAYKSRRGF